MFPLEPSGAVLVLGLARREFVERLALSARLLVGVGEEDDVRSARREFASLDNVMFVTGSRDHIPWADAQFSLVIDLSGLGATPEMSRVLARNGRIADSF